MARVRGITILPDTHTFTYEWNEPPCLYTVSIRQMAPPERGKAHPITVHYSFIDLERMKGCVGLVGWPCSGQKSVCCHFSIFSAVMPRSPAPTWYGIPLYTHHFLQSGSGTQGSGTYPRAPVAHSDFWMSMRHAMSWFGLLSSSLSESRLFVCNFCFGVHSDPFQYATKKVLACMWNKSNCSVICTLFKITFLGKWDERGERPFFWPLASFPDHRTYMYSVHSIQYCLSSCFEQFCWDLLRTCGFASCCLTDRTINLWLQCVRQIRPNTAIRQSDNCLLPINM